MKAIDFVVRTGMGAVERGTISGQEAVETLFVGNGKEISLNLARGDLTGFNRVDNDLAITLADGRVILLQNYFSDAGAANRLFISANGELNEVTLAEGSEGVLHASYGPTEAWGKWSPSDDLIFLGRPEVVMAPIDDGVGEDVSMLGAALLGGPLLGLGGAAAAGLGGAALLAATGDGKGDGGTSGSGTRADPTVDNPENTYEFGGDDETDPSIDITGTGEPGSEVTVEIDGNTVVTTVRENGTWTATFTGSNFPSDGTHDVGVTVVDSDGRTTVLDGPNLVVDLTPPVVDVTEGTVTVDHVENGVDHPDGVTISGQGEPGASIDVTINGHTESTTVDQNGGWSVNFGGDHLPAGEYDASVVIISRDAYGNSTRVTDTVRIDTIAQVTIDADPIEIDDVVNASELPDGVVVTGTTQPGSSVVVTVGGVSTNATVAPDGTWTVTVPAEAFPGGEYDTNIQVTATDEHGNTAEASRTIRVDTVAEVTIDADPVEGDNVVNAVEVSDGVILTGTTQPGSTVMVTVGGVATEATVDANGTWSVTIPGDAFPDGEYDTTVVVSATDAAGNTAEASRTIHIDTETGVTIDLGQSGGDDIVSASENAAGVTLTGTAQPGSTVMVTVSGMAVEATVEANGTWSVTLPKDGFPNGEYDTTVQVTTTDAAGNTAEASHVIQVDTVTTTAIEAGVSGGDDLVNAVEAENGIVIDGSAEPGAAIVVEFQGHTYQATADNNGHWAVNVPSGNITRGDYDSPVTVTATDAVGNVATATHTIRVDTTSAVDFNEGSVEGDNVINAQEMLDGFTLTGTTQPGSSVEVSVNGTTLPATVDANGNWTVDFPAGTLPGGTYTASASVVAVNRNGNIATDTMTFGVDTEGRVDIQNAPVETDNTINAAELADGVTLTGTTEPGSTVMVTAGGVTRAATVDANGNWTVDFAASDIPTGTYDLAVTAVATDAAGNVTQDTSTIHVDTEGAVSLETATVETDGTVNNVERADGVVLTGTTEPGSTVQVTVNGVTRAATVDANGNWTAVFAPTDLPTGETTVDVIAVATDAAGNVTEANGTLNIDTYVRDFAVNNDVGGVDLVVNGEEANQGITLSGTTEPGSTVVVEFNGIERLATVDANGNWSAYFGSAEVPRGETTADYTVTATDLAGNVASDNGTVVIDTYVNELEAVAGPSVINAGIAQQGLTLSGEVEPGSQVTVMYDGMAYVASVDAAGNWTVDIPAGAFAVGEYDATFVIEATDAAGNVDSINQIVPVDTLPPETALVEAVNFDRSGDIRDISVETTQDDLAVGHVQADGSITDLNVSETPLPNGESYVGFSNPVPDGSHLVVTNTDAAGNVRGTYLAVNEDGTSEVNLSNPTLLSNLEAHQIEAIDLSFAENSTLTITEAQIKALSTHSDQVTVYGGNDDTVRITGAVAAGTETDADGNSYNVYSLGDEAKILVDDDITNVII